MSGIPVVIVEEGGIPVVPVESRAPVMTVAENGLGMPIVLSSNGIGMPARIDGLVVPPEGYALVTRTADGQTHYAVNAAGAYYIRKVA